MSSTTGGPAHNVASDASDPPGQRPTRPRDRHGQVVREVARRAAVPTLEDAAATTRATLTAISGWLDPDLRDELAASLPDDIATGLTSATVSLPDSDVVACYRRVATETGNASLHDVALRCAAVLAVAGEALPPPLVSRLAAAVPHDIAALVGVPTQPH